MRSVTQRGRMERPLTSFLTIHSPAGRFCRMSPATSHASSCPCGQQDLHQTLATEGRTTVARHGQDHSRGGGRSGRGVPSCLCLRPLCAGGGSGGAYGYPLGPSSRGLSTTDRTLQSLVRVTGFEPAWTWSQTRWVTGLPYTRMVDPTGLAPATIRL